MVVGLKAPTTGGLRGHEVSKEVDDRAPVEVLGPWYRAPVAPQEDCISQDRLPGRKGISEYQAGKGASHRQEFPQERH